MQYHNLFQVKHIIFSQGKVGIIAASFANKKVPDKGLVYFIKILVFFFNSIEILNVDTAIP